MNTIISISISEEDEQLVLQTSLQDQVELIGILELVKMQILNVPSKPNVSKSNDIKFPIPKTEA